MKHYLLLGGAPVFTYCESVCVVEIKDFEIKRFVFNDCSTYLVSSLFVSLLLISKHVFAGCFRHLSSRTARASASCKC